jgi:hypothetical protein
LTRIKIASGCKPHYLRSRDFLLTNKSRAKYNYYLLGQILCKVKMTVLSRKSLNPHCALGTDHCFGQQFSYGWRWCRLGSLPYPQSYFLAASGGHRTVDCRDEAMGKIMVVKHGTTRG